MSNLKNQLNVNTKMTGGLDLESMAKSAGVDPNEIAGKMGDMAGKMDMDQMGDMAGKMGDMAGKMDMDQMGDMAGKMDMSKLGPMAGMAAKATGMATGASGASGSGGGDTNKLIEETLDKISNKMCQVVEDNSDKMIDNIQSMIIKNSDWKKLGSRLTDVFTEKISSMLQNVEWSIVTKDGIDSIQTTDNNDYENKDFSSSVRSPSTDGSTAVGTGTEEIELNDIEKQDEQNETNKGEQDETSKGEQDETSKGEQDNDLNKELMNKGLELGAKMGSDLLNTLNKKGEEGQGNGEEGKDEEGEGPPEQEETSPEQEDPAPEQEDPAPEQEDPAPEPEDPAPAPEPEPEQSGGGKNKRKSIKIKYLTKNKTRKNLI
jgi:hypothetical protein